NLSVRRAIEWAHRRLRHAAASAIGGVAEQHDLRTGVALARGLEHLAPAIVDLAQDAGDHAAHLVGGRAGLGLRGGAVALIARRAAAAALQDFGAADQDARINAEGVGDEAEHDDGANAKAAAAHGQADAAATAHHAAARVVAAVFDVV